VADVISAMSEALAAHLDLDAMAESTLRELAVRTGCDASALLVVTNGRIDLAGSRGIRDAGKITSAEAVLAAVRTTERTVLHLPPTLVVNGALVDFTPQEIQVLPIHYGVLTVGVLVVAFAEPSATEAASVIHSTLPGLAVALNNSMNHEILQRVAALDPLTGVYNRRFGQHRLAEEFGRAQRS
jgi:hypothetical protein